MINKKHFSFIRSKRVLWKLTGKCAEVNGLALASPSDTKSGYKIDDWKYVAKTDPMLGYG
jgi:hypothetical protein